MRLYTYEEYFGIEGGNSGEAEEEEIREKLQIHYSFNENS
jgi:hypothetical protein